MTMLSVRMLSRNEVRPHSCAMGQRMHGAPGDGPTQAPRWFEDGAKQCCWLAVLLDLGEEGEFAGWGEEAGFDSVGGEFAELV